jgi:hypothetical protein
MNLSSVTSPTMAATRRPVLAREDLGKGLPVLRGRVAEEDDRKLQPEFFSRDRGITSCRIIKPQIRQPITRGLPRSARLVLFLFSFSAVAILFPNTLIIACPGTEVLVLNES